MKNRLIFPLFSILLVSLLFSPNAFSQETVVRVAPYSVTTVADPHTVDIVIENGQNVAGYQVKLQFDPTVLQLFAPPDHEYTGFQHGDYLPKNAFFGEPHIDNEAGTVRFAATSFTGESNGYGVLATLTFKIIKSTQEALVGSRFILPNSDTRLSNKEGTLSFPRLENSKVFPQRIHDLVVESVQAIPIDTTEERHYYSKGEKFQLRATIRNKGNVKSAANVKIIFYGPASTETEKGNKLGEATIANLDPNRSIEVSLPNFVPAPDTSDTYYYTVCIGNSSVKCSKIEIKVEELPDLVVETVTANKTTLSPGGTFTLAATLKNQGFGPADAPIYYRWHRSTHPDIHNMTGSERVLKRASEEIGETRRAVKRFKEGSGPLVMSADEYSTQNMFITAPEEPGIYYYSVCAESPYPEIDPNNNCSDDVTITVEPPDLVSVESDVAGSVVEPPDLVSVESDVAGSVRTNFILKIHDKDPYEKFNCVAYSPDGTILAGGSDDNAIYLWDSRTGELLHTFLDNEKPQHGNVHSIAFSQRGDSQSGDWFAIGGEGGRIRVWKKRTDNTWAEAARNQNFTPPQVIHVGRVVWSVAFSHDETKLACGKSNDSFRSTDTIDVWTLDGNSTWSHKVTLSGHRIRVNSVAFHPIQHHILASASADETTAMWNINTQERRTYKDEHMNQAVNSVVFSPSGTYLASGDNNNNVIVWNVDGGYEVQTFDDRDTDDNVLSVVFMSDTVLLSVGEGLNIHKWEIGQQDPIIFIKSGKRSNSIAYNPKFKSIAISIIGGITLWSPDKKGAGTVRQFAWTEEGNFRANDVTIETKLIDLLISPDLISDVAYTKNYTYFILRPHFALVTEVGEIAVGEIEKGGIKHGKCTITLDTADSDYWMFLLEPEQDLRGQIADLSIFTTLSIVAYIPKKAFEIYSDVKSILTDVVAIFKKVTNTFEESNAGLEVTIEPAESINILNVAVVVGKVVANAFLGWDFKPITYPYLCIIPGRLSSIDIRIEQNYDFPSSPSIYTVTYEGTWDMEDSAATAPRASVMSLADYPPFQQLPPELQAYLLQHFGDPANLETINPELWQIPEQTSLLPNYPNPFNPETWVPYQLAAPADVTLTIYDIHGRVVRDLDLGHQRAGMYHGRTRAAHWDGRNAQGEPVASGVYFYTLKAGEFTATQKMLIRK